MTRNSPNILPFCQHCGEYKGLGPCKNAECNNRYMQGTDLIGQHKRCIICGDNTVIVCCRCGKGYCELHAKCMNDISLENLNQHLGKCVICGQIVCEHCWIFNQKGQVTCQIHSFNPKYDE